MFRGVLVSMALLFAFITVAGATDFPYREKYPNLSYISTEDLAAKQAKGEAVVVDVRSTIEYDVIHSTDAVHIPLSKKTFTEDVSKLLTENPGKAMVFYCNGVKCLKSYEAAEKAVKELKCDHCFVYDAGIPEWAEVHPEMTFLLGKKLDDRSKLISETELKSHCLPFDQFKAKASEPGSMVIDIRDFVQTSGKLPGLENARTIPMDQFIPNFIQKGAEKDKTLLIFDQVGKQTEWLIYYLKQNDYQKYCFLDGGATAVLGEQHYK